MPCGSMTFKVLGMVCGLLLVTMCCSVVVVVVGGGGGGGGGGVVGSMPSVPEVARLHVNIKHVIDYSANLMILNVFGVPMATVTVPYTGYHSNR